MEENRQDSKHVQNIPDEVWEVVLENLEASENRKYMAVSKDFYRENVNVIFKKKDCRVSIRKSV